MNPSLMKRSAELERSTVLDSVAIAQGTALETAVLDRAAIFAMTQAAEDAVLRPQEAGAWSHEFRHALAARIAGQNGLPDLAARYAQGVDDPGLRALCNPATMDLTPVVVFMDGVSVSPRDVTADDVAGLQQAGVADADIVRLAELNAFLAYQCRLITGLNLMNGGAA